MTSENSRKPALIKAVCVLAGMALLAAASAWWQGAQDAENERMTLEQVEMSTHYTSSTKQKTPEKKPPHSK